MNTRCVRLLRGCDAVINRLIACLIVVLGVYGGLGVWDVWSIYHKSGVSDQIMAYKPSVDTGWSFERLRAVNPDVVAWLELDDSPIDFPVLQGESNMDYINRDVMGEFSLAGSIFLDWRNNPDFTDPYSIVYGHHMEADAMFGSLPRWCEAEYFNDHRTGKLVTPGNADGIELFACVHTDAYDQTLFNPTITTPAEVDAVLTRVRHTAQQYRETQMSDDTRLVVLSTCYNASTNGRIMVIGVLHSDTREAPGSQAREDTPPTPP